jgi:hypothetical protein
MIEKGAGKWMNSSGDAGHSNYGYSVAIIYKNKSEYNEYLNSDN